MAHCQSQQPYPSIGRKRVRKACDRCCLKKIKCDGVTPCSRCRSDNAICVFGGRRKTRSKNVPKGYVELLETQQDCLVKGLRELYSRSIEGKGLISKAAKVEPSGHLPVHDMLGALGALDQMNGENFEENLSVMQQKLSHRNIDCQQPLESSSKTYNMIARSFSTSRNSISQPGVSPSSSTDSAYDAKAQSEILMSSHTDTAVEAFCKQESLLLQDPVNPTAIKWPDYWTCSDDVAQYVINGGLIYGEPHFGESRETMSTINEMPSQHLLDNSQSYDNFDFFFNTA